MKMLVKFRTQVPMGYSMALGFSHAITCEKVEFDHDSLILDGRPFNPVFKFEVTVVTEAEKASE